MSFLARDEDTICAVATPPGRGGISVIRVSGLDAGPISQKLCSFLPEALTSHNVYYGILKFKNSVIDEVLVTYFQKGKSFTGEDTVEISCHGSPAITAQILTALIESGARMAEPGEFTYRAFMSGRIDLVQAEGVLEVIESNSSRSSELALRQLQGHHSSQLVKIEDQLIWVLAHCEANIDFAAEDIEVANQNELSDRLLSTQSNIQSLVKNYKYGKGIKDGLFITLFGYPNVGKSSLLNSFVGYERAIVADQPGTTRDVVEGEVWHKGFRLQFSDTAGLRESDNQIEQLGIQKTREMVGQADKVMLVMDLSRELTIDPVILELRDTIKNKLVIVFNKMDISDHPESEIINIINNLTNKIGLASGQIPFFQVSAAKNMGLEPVLDHLIEDYQKISESGDVAVLSNVRHKDLLEKSLVGIEKAIGQLQSGESPEFIAFELQTSLMAIQEILGKKFDDEIMDRVFKEFCLGK